jgi:hypothetical protein
MRPFAGPIHLEPRDAAALDPERKPARCTCPDSPWCTGPTGPYWLRCASTCRSCHPRSPRRRGVRNP